MAITLTSNLPLPPVSRLRVVNVQIDDANAIATVTVQAGGAGGRLYNQYSITVVDAPAAGIGLQVNASPATFDDLITVVQQLVVANGFTALEAAYRGAASRAAAFRAVEQRLLTDGWLVQPGLAGTVS